MSNDEVSISAITGVAVIAIIIVLAAAFVYYHVESIKKSSPLHIEGMVVDIHRNLSFSNNYVWDVTLDVDGIENSYHMVFNETYPPLYNLHLRFYYVTVTINGVECLDIQKIEQLR